MAEEMCISPLTPTGFLPKDTPLLGDTQSPTLPRLSVESLDPLLKELPGWSRRCVECVAIEFLKVECEKALGFVRELKVGLDANDESEKSEPQVRRRCSSVYSEYLVLSEIDIADEFQDPSTSTSGKPKLRIDTKTGCELNVRAIRARRYPTESCNEDSCWPISDDGSSIEDYFEPPLIEGRGDTPEYDYSDEESDGEKSDKESDEEESDDEKSDEEGPDSLDSSDEGSLALIGRKLGWQEYFANSKPRVPRGQWWSAVWEQELQKMKMREIRKRGHWFSPADGEPARFCESPESYEDDEVDSDEETSRDEEDSGDDEEVAESPRMALESRICKWAEMVDSLSTLDVDSVGRLDSRSCKSPKEYDQSVDRPNTPTRNAAEPPCYNNVTEAHIRAFREEYARLFAMPDSEAEEGSISSKQSPGISPVEDFVDSPDSQEMTISPEDIFRSFNELAHVNREFTFVFRDLKDSFPIEDDAVSPTTVLPLLPADLMVPSETKAVKNKLPRSNLWCRVKKAIKFYYQLKKSKK